MMSHPPRKAQIYHNASPPSLFPINVRVRPVERPTHGCRSRRIWLHCVGPLHCLTV